MEMSTDFATIISSWSNLCYSRWSRLAIREELQWIRRCVLTNILPTFQRLSHLSFLFSSSKIRLLLVALNVSPNEWLELAPVALQQINLPNYENYIAKLGHQLRTCSKPGLRYRCKHVIWESAERSIPLEPPFRIWNDTTTDCKS